MEVLVDNGRRIKMMAVGNIEGPFLKFVRPQYTPMVVEEIDSSPIELEYDIFFLAGRLNGYPLYIKEDILKK
jgi:hypothetical protein